MKALRKLTAESDRLTLVEVDQPIPGPGEVRVEVHAAGLCGTDLHIMEGGYSSRPPVTLGHEVSGVVVEVGAGVDESWLTTPVAMETFYSTCARCDRCREGRINLCQERVSIGSGSDGGFAESVVVPAKNLHPLPAGVSTTTGALMEPLACVCQSLLDPSVVQPGDRVLVTGPGTIGLLAAQLALYLGAVVTMAGLPSDGERLAVAEQLGIATVTDPDQIGTGRFDVAIECAGAGPAMASALNALRHGGSYVQMGQTHRAVSVPLALASFKELTITGGFASTPRSWRRAVELLARDVVQLPPLVSAALPLRRWEEAFDSTARGEGIKYLLDPRLP